MKFIFFKIFLLLSIFSFGQIRDSIALSLPIDCKGGWHRGYVGSADGPSAGPTAASDPNRPSPADGDFPISPLDFARLPPSPEANALPNSDYAPSAQWPPSTD